VALLGSLGYHLSAVKLGPQKRLDIGLVRGSAKGAIRISASAMFCIVVLSAAGVVVLVLSAKVRVCVSGRALARRLP